MRVLRNRYKTILYKCIKIKQSSKKKIYTQKETFK